MKKVLLFALSFSGIVLGLLIVAQFSAPKAFTINSPIQEIEAKEILIKEFVEEQSFLLNRTKELRKKIEEKQIEIAEQTEMYNLNFLDDLKKDSGFKNASGNGLEISLSNKSSSEQNNEDGAIILASDLRDIVNALKAGQADAISINNQRIVYSSVISSVGNTILINNVHTSSPFLIRAVGDSNSMIASIQNKELLKELYERIETNKFRFHIQILDDVFVPSYNSTIKIDYINLVE
jgi:uncharacterized protein YlxW (UPF0749 family)